MSWKGCWKINHDIKGCMFSSLGPAPSSQPSPLSPQTERTEPPPAVAVRPYIPDHPSRPQSPRKGPATMNSSSIYSMYLQQPQAKNYGSLSNRTTVKAGKLRLKYVCVSCRHRGRNEKSMSPRSLQSTVSQSSPAPPRLRPPSLSCKEQEAWRHVSRMWQMEGGEGRAVMDRLCLRPMLTTSLVPSVPLNSPQSVGESLNPSRNSWWQSTRDFLFPTSSQPTLRCVIRAMLTWTSSADAWATHRDPWRNAAPSPSPRAHRGQTSRNCCTRGWGCFVWCSMCDKISHLKPSCQNTVCC